MSVAMVNGVSVYYEVAGSGEWLVLTHGSWTDASGWAQVVARLSERYRVLVWDRRGHSRSKAGEGRGSQAEDAADLAALIERVSDGPVHAVGSSYGANVTLTLVAERPDLVASAAAHEPPVFGLLEGTRDRGLVEDLAAVEGELSVVGQLISSGDHRGAAEHFVEHVALGPGSWSQLPAAFRSVLEGNAATFLDELADETSLAIDTAALAVTDVPLLLTHGTDSPRLFPAVVARLAEVLPRARVEVLVGSGHVPHVTHPDAWTAGLVTFHQQTQSNT